jgi:hypothetical protein
MLPLYRCLTVGLLFVPVAAVGSPAAAQDAILRMTRADCKRLVAHEPAPDVAYQPGVDVRGGKVAPPALDDSDLLEIPEELSIPIEVDLHDRLGLPPDPNAFEARVILGSVEVRGERLYFNGRPLEDEAQSELSVKCREALGKKRE